MKAIKELICCVIYMYGGKSKQASGKAPDGKVRVEAAVEALPRLAGHVLVQVLAVHPQHRCHPPTSSLKLGQLIFPARLRRRS